MRVHLLNTVLLQAAVHSQLLDTRLSGGSAASSMLQTGSPPLAFRDVRLGVLIRAEPSGPLYRGTWQHEPVSVKVRHSIVACAAPLTQPSVTCAWAC